MNKLFLTMPKLLIEEYLKKNYNSLTEEDALYLLNKGINFKSYYYQDNSLLNESSKILEYVINHDPSAIMYFKKNTFNDDVIQKMANMNYIPSSNLIMNVPRLLNNEKIKLNVFLSSFSNDLVSLLSNEQFDEKILRILEKQESYTPEIKHIMKYDILGKSPLLMKRAIANNPRVIMYIKDFDLSLIDIISNENITLEVIRNSPELSNNPMVLFACFRENVNAIVLFDEKLLNNDVITNALTRGYIPKEEDFLENPNLGKNVSLMEFAINNNPKLIKYLKVTNISPSIIDKALSNYQLSEEDLINNNNLCYNSYLMNKLIKQNPFYEIYFANLGNSRREALITKYLEAGKLNYIIDKPFLNNKLYPGITSDNILKLIEALKVDINEDDINLQQGYYDVLNQIIYCISVMKYIDSKSTSIFQGFNSLDVKVKHYFEEISNNPSKMDELVELIYVFINGYGQEVVMDESYIRENLASLYRKYLTDYTLSKEDTTPFFSEVLDKQQGKYKKDKIEELINELTKIFSLTKKKENSILLSKKMDKITNIFINGRYQEISTSKEEIFNLLYSTRNYLNSMKDFKKANIFITNEQFNILDTAFINGTLNAELIKSIINTNDEKIIKVIFNNYSKIKLGFIDKVVLKDDEAYVSVNEKLKLGFNYNNFLIGDKTRYCRNIAKLIMTLNNEQVNDILDNAPYFQEILKIIPFADIFPSYSINDLIVILSNYYQSKERILEVEGKEDDYDILNKFDYLIKVANGYASSDDIQTVVLGNNVLYKVHVCNSKKYYDFYLKMLDRYKGLIPPIEGVFENYEFISSNYHDTERLLIGKNVSTDSCIDLDHKEGAETYKKVLTEEDGDVLIVRNKNSHAFVARILMFRKGNMVMLGPIIDEGNNGTNSIALYNRAFIDEIANQIINKAKSANDNIDYVFLTRSLEEFDYLRYKFYRNEKFQSEFVHADLEREAYLVAASSQEKLSNFRLSDVHYDELPKASYLMPRREIKTNELAVKEEIDRLRALRIAKEVNLDLKGEYARNFEYYFEGEYSQIIYGEDWYIGVRKDGTLDELIVPTKDERSMIEFKTTKRELLNNLMYKNNKAKQLDEEVYERNR